ncbi:hypothetical protein HDU99_000484, partial [Rhizoclosmatium hyalinum]
TSSIPPPSNFQCCALDSNTSQMLCIGGVAALDLLYRFDVRKSMWIPPVSVPNGLAQRSGHSCAVSKGFFYVLGGISLGGFDVSVPFYSFNVGTQAFTSMPTPPFANRYGHQLVTLPDGNLFVGFGALVSSSTSLLDSWTFNVITQSWASLPTTNSLSIADGSSCTPWSSSANSVGGVFCYGGVTTSGNANPHLSFLDLKARTWTDLGVPKDYTDGLFSPAGTFGAAISVINGGTAIVMRAGGVSLGNGIITYLVNSNTIGCSKEEPNQNSGSFYGVSPLGPLSCNDGGSCSGGTSNIPLVSVGWTKPPEKSGFPVATGITFVPNTFTSGGSSTGGSSNTAGSVTGGGTGTGNTGGNGTPGTPGTSNGSNGGSGGSSIGGSTGGGSNGSSGSSGGSASNGSGGGSPGTGSGGSGGSSSGTGSGGSNNGSSSQGTNGSSNSGNPGQNPTNTGVSNVPQPTGTDGKNIPVGTNPAIVPGQPNASNPASGSSIPIASGPDVSSQGLRTQSMATVSGTRISITQTITASLKAPAAGSESVTGTAKNGTLTDTDAVVVPLPDWGIALIVIAVLLYLA